MVQSRTYMVLMTRNPGLVRLVYPLVFQEYKKRGAPGSCSEGSQTGTINCHHSKNEVTKKLAIRVGIKTRKKFSATRRSLGPPMGEICNTERRRAKSHRVVSTLPGQGLPT